MKDINTNTIDELQNINLKATLAERLNHNRKIKKTKNKINEFDKVLMQAEKAAINDLNIKHDQGQDKCYSNQQSEMLTEQALNLREKI
jgi:hypothetical protein